MADVHFMKAKPKSRMLQITDWKTKASSTKLDTAA